MSTPEGRVKAKVKRALKHLGRDCWQFMPVQTGFGAPALDFLLSVRGRFVAIETKVPGKSLTPLQETTKAAIEASGGIVLVVWDDDTLAIAMKIILALEFAPDVPQPTQGDHLIDCIREAKGGRDDIGFCAVRIVDEDEKDKGERSKHLLPVLSTEEIVAAASRDHGASGEEPE